MNKKDLITANTTSQIYNIIRMRGEINRMGITEISGVSKSTISLQINKLKQLGMIREDQPSDGTQKKLNLSICENIGVVAGVFLGISKLTIALFRLDMSIISEEKYSFESINDPVGTNERIISLLKELCLKKSIANLWGIGIGFPFPVNFKEGKPDSPPNVPRWNNYPLKELYEKEFDCPVLVDNDVNVMALGEGSSSSIPENESFLFVKVGTGIGSGLVVDGKIYRGANGCAGDIGHIGVEGSRVHCMCGNTGCLEAEAGGKALAEKALLAARSGESPYLKDILENRLGDGEELTALHINRGAAEGDMTCVRLVREAGRQIGEVLAKLVNFFNPSSIVIGGGLSAFGTLFIGAIREAIISRSPHLATYELNIPLSKLGESSGAIGAGTLILDHLFSADEFSRTVIRNIP